MRAFYVAALALALAGTSLAAQAKPPTTRQQRARRAASSARASAAASARTRLKLWTKGAIVLAARLEKKQDHTPEHRQSDANALGRNLADARRALADLERAAPTAERPRLDSVRTHLKQARSHYDALARAVPDEDRVATHAGALRQHLVAAQNALNGRAATVRPRKKPTK